MLSQNFKFSFRSGLNQPCTYHWCIKSIYNEFAIAIDSTLEVVPFGFCSVQVMPLFGTSFCLLRRSDKIFAYSGLLLFWDLSRFKAILYTSQPPGLEIAVILSLFRRVETANQVQVVNLSKRVGKDRVFLGLAALLLRTSLGAWPRELPQSSHVTP